MKHLFIPYELALKAKQAGFNEPCIAYFQDNEFNWSVEPPKVRRQTVEAIDYNTESKNPDFVSGLVSAPLYQQIIDWFRDKHEIWIFQMPQFDGISFQFHTWLYWKDDVRDLGICFDSKKVYAELDKAIEQAFTLLTRNVG